MEPTPNPGYPHPEQPNVPPTQYGQPNVPPTQYGQPAPNIPPPPSGPPPQYGQPAPGAGQYGYQPGPQYGQPLPTGSSGLSPALAVIIAYIFGVVGPLIILAVEKQNNFVRFHALQALLVQVAVFVAEVALFGLGFGFGVGSYNIGFLGVFSFLFGCLGYLALFGFGIYMLIVLIQAATGKTMRIPVIADYADRLLPTFMR